MNFKYITQPLSETIIIGVIIDHHPSSKIPGGHSIIKAGPVNLSCWRVDVYKSWQEVNNFKLELK